MTRHRLMNGTRESGKAPGSRSAKKGNHVAPAARGVPWHALHQTLGNQGVQRLLREGAVQAKLRVSRPNDRHEQEADRVSGQVMRMPEPQRRGHLPTQDVGRAELRHTVAPPIVQELLSSSGQPLDAATRAFMEPRFGVDLGAVRIHADAEADRSARSIDALAYTAGDHIAFRADRYDPSIQEGKRLLAHELTHTLQQSRGEGSPTHGPARVEQHAVPGTLLRKRPIPDVDTPDTFTVVSTKKLDENGRFTGPLLDFISRGWTKKAVGSPPELAQQIVDALESSNQFVTIAKNLDAFLLKHPDMDIAVAASSMGTKFVPANTPFQGSPEGPVQTPGLTAPANTHFIFIDFVKSEIAFHSGATGPQQIAVFVQNIIHETTHAFDLVNGLGTSGLSGALEEEQRARKSELKALEEIRLATKDPDLGKELSTQIAQTKAGGLTLAAIAGNLTQEGTETYLESYYLGRAVNGYTSKRDAVRKKVENAGLTGFDGLASIEELSDFDFMIYFANATFIINANARGFSADRDKSGAKLPITNAHRVTLLKLLDTSLTLKQVTDVADTGLNDAETLMVYHVQLIQAYRIKDLIAKEWTAFAKNPSPAAQSAVADANAAKLLGRPGAYAALRRP